MSSAGHFAAAAAAATAFINEKSTVSILPTLESCPSAAAAAAVGFARTKGQQEKKTDYTRPAALVHVTNRETLLKIYAGWREEKNKRPVQ
jgi:hypothetical protein